MTPKEALHYLASTMENDTMKLNNMAEEEFIEVIKGNISKLEAFDIILDIFNHDDVKELREKVYELRDIFEDLIA